MHHKGNRTVITVIIPIAALGVPGGRCGRLGNAVIPPDKGLEPGARERALQKRQDLGV